MQPCLLPALLLLAACTLLSAEAFSLGTPLPLNSLAQQKLGKADGRPPAAHLSRLRGGMSGPKASETAGTWAALPQVRPERGLTKTELGYVNFFDYQAQDSSSEYSLPVVCLHKYPESAAEFAKAAPILSTTHNRRVVAVDMLGFGASDNPSRSCSVLELANSIVSVCDALGIERFNVAGSLTGSKLAVAIASRYPERVGALCVTHLYEIPPPEDGGGPKQQQNPHPPQAWPLEEDGSHMAKVWGVYKGHVPIEEMQKKANDEFVYRMKERELIAQGISMQAANQLPICELVGTITCPILCILGSEAGALLDSFGIHGTERLGYGVSSLPAGRKEVVTVEGANTFLLSSHPKEWADAIHDFISRAESGAL